MARRKTHREIVRENILKIRKMRRQGATYREIGEAFGVSAETVRLSFDENAIERDRMRAKKYRAKRYNNRKGFRHIVDERPEVLGEPPPLDTRDLTARILGDPLPGRSHLDRMRQKEAANGPT